MRSLAALLLLAAPASAQLPAAPFEIAETGESFARLQDAVDAAGVGEATILIASGVHRQCAVQKTGRIAYVALEPGSAVFAGAACEGKAALVLGGEAALVEGVVFRQIRVPDRNGAGIRLEGGDLTVRDSMFRDGENGILAANRHRGTIRVERSTFSGLGLCPPDHGCSHSIYNSGEGPLVVHRTRFERGTGGHYVKSRSGRIEVTESSFDDSSGRATNYMIDLPEGASGRIAGNAFVQGRDKDNYSAFVTIAPEGAEHSSAGLVVEDNEAALAPGVSRRTAFVADWSEQGPQVERNRLAPAIRPYERR